MNGKMAKMLRKLKMDSNNGKKDFHTWPPAVKNTLRMYGSTLVDRMNSMQNSIPENSDAV